MSLTHGLSLRTVDQIVRVLAHFSEVERAVLFGSRAKATHKPGSDIDLALIGPLLDWRKVGKIYDRLDDLMLPHRFSLILLDGGTDAEVAANIRRVGIALYQREHIDEAVIKR